MKALEETSHQLKSELDKLKEARDILQTKLDNEIKEKEAMEKIRMDKSQVCTTIFQSVVNQSQNLIKEAIAKFDDPVLLSCKSGAEYLLTLLHPAISSLERMKKSYAEYDPNSQANGKKS